MEVYLIVGLGNPGEKYAHTRHNAGFDTLEYLERKYGVRTDKRVPGGLTAEVREGEKKIVLCRPQTYMNASGECVGQLVHWYKCPLDHLMVLYDDIDLPLGQVRVRRGGGPGTHNGMRSVMEYVDGPDFPRVRIGTGDRPAGWDLVDWVLGRPQDPEERKRMDEAFALGAECAADWVENGIDHAMQLCGRRQKKEKPPRKAEEPGEGSREESTSEKAGPQADDKKQEKTEEERNE